MKKLSNSLLFLALVVALVGAPTVKSFASSGVGDKAIFLPLVLQGGLRDGGLVLNHSTADIAKIPATFIDGARTTIRLSYDHTSHGSQIVTGMQYWMRKDARYAFVVDGSEKSGMLSLADTRIGGDLGSPDWADRTRDYLHNAGSDRNLVMWSWCGQLDGYSSADVQKYLNDMSQLEQEFPAVRFVYMTQHTVWNGDAANNDLVRSFAISNGKILFDFADMEKFTPDGVALPTDQVNDSCPWCQNWCSTHASYCADLPAKMDVCAHTDKLLCKIKSQAFWWMLARLTGWDGVSTN
jgi:hypothetical protein